MQAALPSPSRRGVRAWENYRNDHRRCIIAAPRDAVFPAGVGRRHLRLELDAAGKKPGGGTDNGGRTDRRRVDLVEQVDPAGLRREPAVGEQHPGGERVADRSLLERLEGVQDRLRSLADEREVAPRRRVLLERERERLETKQIRGTYEIFIIMFFDDNYGL